MSDPGRCSEQSKYEAEQILRKILWTVLRRLRKEIEDKEMKQRVIWMMMAAACVILGAVSVFIYISKDHTPPEISIEKRDITYTEGDPMRV